VRIVGGKFRGRKLATPRSDLIRPTSDRTRESLFSILGHRMSFEGIRVMDLVAGTGAQGLEAMSRGASYCLFVDDAPQARALLRANIEALALQASTKIFRRDATRLGPSGNIGKFDLAFLDPPYAKGLGEKAMAALLADDWLEPDALVVLEERKDALPDQLSGFRQFDHRAFGDTAIAIYQLAAKPDRDR